MSLPDFDVVSLARRYLGLLRTALDMDVVWVSEHEGNDMRLVALDGAPALFDLHEGQELPWEGGYCARVHRGELPVLVRDARLDPRTAALPITERLGVGAYASAPILLGEGRLFGSLCGVSRAPRHDLGESDERLISSLASALAEELVVLDAREHTRRGRRDEILQVADAGAGMRMVVQPIVALPSMAVLGCEALARFDRPPARPDYWFADARRLGVGDELELAAVRAALALLAELPAAMYISVNASPILVRDPAFVALLETSEPSRIVVEITEHSSIGDYDRLATALDALRARGVRIAVDDAGAGYATFRHILRLRPELIKLDRDMVTGIATDQARQALVGALVGFASQLGAGVVAEGIETREELDTLVGLGVGLGQGYYIARPGPLPLPTIGATG